VTSQLPEIYLVRHGQTAWALSGRHTGRSDIPLTPVGEENARRVGPRLAGIAFARVFTSPSLRARRTCELAGFAAMAKIDPDLAEWDYGQYEGLTSVEIHKNNPTWQALRDDAPGGESIAELTGRADRVVERLRAGADKTLVFSSGHFLRVLAARWLGFDAIAGQRFALGTGSVSILGYEHALVDPVICLWNEQPR
jgi:broad specificity phosphatase PhoE